MARKSIGSLVAELILKDGDFSTRLEKAAKKTETKGAEIERSIKNIATTSIVAFSAAAAAAVGFTIHGIEKSTEKTAELKRQTDKLGISSASWAAFRLAAQQAGSSVDGLEQSMRRVNRSGFEAKMGDTTKLAAFDKLRINVENFINLRPDAQFKVVADALNGLENANQRAAVAQQLFGIGAEQIYSILQMGSEGLAKAAEMADLLGLSLSNVDAQTVLDAANNVNLVKSSFEGLNTQLSAQIAPVLSEISSLIINQINEWGGVVGISRTVFQGIVTGAAVALQVMDGFEMMWHMLKAGFWAVSSVGGFVLSGIVAGFELVTTTASRLINVLIDAHNRHASSADQWERFNTTMTVSNALFETALENGKKASDEYGKALATLDEASATDRVIEWIDQAGVKWTAVAAAEQKAKDHAKTYGDVVTSSFDKAATAIQGVKNLLLSLDAVSEKGSASINAVYARRAQSFQEKAEVAEARGQFQLSDDMRAQARHFAGLVKRRQQTETMQLDSQQVSGKTVGLPMSDAQRAEELHRQAKVAWDRGQFGNAAKLDQQAKQLDLVVTNNTKRPPTPVSGAKPATPSSGKGGNTAAASAPVMPAQQTASSGGVSPASGAEAMLAKLDTLIATLNGLPSKLGVA